MTRNDSASKKNTSSASSASSVVDSQPSAMMFTTFETNTTTTVKSPEPIPTPPRPRAKRTQVARACDWCRVHRIKCNNQHPCESCKSRGGPCNVTGAIKQATLPHVYREVERLRMRVQELESELQNKHEVTCQPVQQTEDTHFDHELAHHKGSWEGIHIRTARSPQKSWYGAASLFHFIGRIETFLSTNLLDLPPTNSASHLLPNSASMLLDGPTVMAGEDQGGRFTSPPDNIYATDFLTPTQEEYFLGLFWQSYYTSCPILDEFQFKEHYQSLWTTSTNERKPSALVDIIIAVCMQFGMAMLPGAGRGLGTSRANVDNNDPTLAGRWHYQRCQTLLSCELENPTISTLQCHILCSMYLCCGSFHNMADSACGLAVQTAYMLGLHLEPPETMPLREREMRKRVWWTLYVLETKMSMKLGRPFLLYDSSTTCSLPAASREIALLAGASFNPLGDNVTWLTWNLENTKLMLAARTTYTAFYAKVPNMMTGDNGQTIWDDVETYANLLDTQSGRLDYWLANVPEALKTKRQNNGTPFSTDLSALDIEQFEPLWLQRQRLLLELMYHNLCTNLYRPFISFVPTTTPRPLADRTAMKCAAHAMTLTHILHQVLSSTSILTGWHEAFQWQWSAAITLVGFVLAHPESESMHAARSALDLCVAVFESFGNSFAVAASAADIMRELSAKVDMCLGMDMSQQSQSQSQSQSREKQLVLGRNSKKTPSSVSDEASSVESIRRNTSTATSSAAASDYAGAVQMLPMAIPDGPLLNFDMDSDDTAEMQRMLFQSFEMDFTTEAAETYNLEMLWSNISNTFPVV